MHNFLLPNYTSFQSEVGPEMVFAFLFHAVINKGKNDHTFEKKVTMLSVWDERKHAFTATHHSFH